jgi:excisionase family DNA binding protein
MSELPSVEAEWISVREAMKLLRVRSKITIYRLIKNGKVEAMKIGSTENAHYRIKKSSIKP